MDREWAEPFRQQLLGLAEQMQRSQFQGKLDVAGVVQKTLLEASQQAEPNPHPAAKLAWLKAALRHNFQDEVRNLTATKRDVLREQMLGSAELTGKADSPSRRIRKLEEIQELLKFVGELPPEQQEAIRLRYISELSPDGVALKLRKSRAAVNGLLRRGLEALRERLASTKLE